MIESKSIESGNWIEIYQYYKPYARGVSSPKDAKWTGNRRSEKEVMDDQKISEELSAKRAKNQFRRLVNCNINQHHETDKFLTLTFAENISDRTQANYEYMKFIQRLKHNFGKFEYLAVPEKQKRGAIHYHVLLFGLGYVKKEQLEDLWTHGFIKIKAINRYPDIAGYLVKYMQKDTENGRKGHEKRYLGSRGLKKPVIQYNVDIEALKANGQVAFETTFESEFVGVVRYVKILNQ